MRIKVIETHETDGDVWHSIAAVELERSIEITLVDARGNERPLTVGAVLSATEWRNLLRDIETLREYDVEVEFQIVKVYERPERVRGWHRD